MLEKFTRMLMRDGNRAAAQKTLLKALVKLRALAERGADGGSERESEVSSALRNVDQTKIVRLAERGSPSEPEEGTNMSMGDSRTMTPDVLESGGPYERPKSRLPRAPSRATPKPPLAETESVDITAVVNAFQNSNATAQQSESKPAGTQSHAASVKTYLESEVVPILMKGLLSVARERPEDPIEYLSAYLDMNNPKKRE